MAMPYPPDYFGWNCANLAPYLAANNGTVPSALSSSALLSQVAAAYNSAYNNGSVNVNV
jgi:hypothetical protein